MTQSLHSRYWLAPLLLFNATLAYGHGSVTMNDDLCAIEIGFYSAHFAIYQPQTRQHTEYCEDIPDATESVFVIDYLHDVMREVPVDFRIIRDRAQRMKRDRARGASTVRRPSASPTTPASAPSHRATF